jgi:hypothetical protein
MHPLRFVARALLLVRDCVIILFALAFILVTLVASALSMLFETLELRTVYKGDVKARNRARWQHGI